MNQDRKRRQGKTLLKAISSSAETLLNQSSLDKTDIDQFLACIGDALDVDRVCVYKKIGGETDEGVMILQHQWTGRERENQLDDPVHKTISWKKMDLASWEYRLMTRRRIMGVVDRFYHGERRFLQDRGTLAIALDPVFAKRQWWGAVCFEACNIKRIWTDDEQNAFKIAASILGASMDRKNTELSLKNTEMRYRAIVEGQTELIYRHKNDGTLIFINEAYCRYFEKNQKELIGHKFVALMPEEDRTKRDTYFNGFRLEKPVGNIEHRVIMPSGEIRWQKWTDRAIFNEDGEIIEFQSVGQDITEEKKLRQESEYRLQQIIHADKLASLGEVVAGVAHEINNPNSFITYNVPLIEETWELFEPIINEYARANPNWKRSGLTLDELCQDMKEIIQAIKTGSDRISKVVSNLKEFSKIDDSKNFKKVDINEVIDKTLLIVGAQIRKSVDNVDIKLGDNLPLIEGHFQKLEQVVANLSVNAVNAISEKRNGRLSISTRYIQQIDSILIEIEDNGTGMVPEVAKHVFEPFFTTRRRSGGTGLGLSVSYGLIKEHNGTIGVLSRPNRGTRFTVYLPVKKDKTLDLRPTILCVDDDVAVLSMLDRYFVSVKNMPLETITNPEEVLGYLENHPEVDIVLSDIIMPGISGWDLLGKVKEKYPLMPVILYTGYPDALERKPPSAVIPDFIMKKPINFIHLVETINTIGRQIL